MPSRILVLGDFSGRSNRGASLGLEGRPLIRVDRDNLDDVVARLQPELRLTIPGVAEPVKIHFDSMHDFHPDALWHRLPVFAALRREKVRIEEIRPDPVPAGGGLLDQVVAVSTPPHEDVWAKVIRSIVAPHVTPKREAWREDSLVKLGETIAAVMRAILHHPYFQPIEAAWRSLSVVLSRLETGSLYIADVALQDILADLLTAPDLASTNLYRLFVDERPWDSVVGLYEFAPMLAHVALLERLGAIAKAGATPFLAAGSARFGDGLSEAEEAAWNTLLGSPAAPAIRLIWPRFLLRLPYGAKTSSTDSFEFEEMPDTPVHGHYLWGNPAMAAVCTMAQENDELNGLPIHTWRDAAGEPQMKPCGEIWLTDLQARRLLRLGVTPLVSIKDSGSVRLLG